MALDPGCPQRQSESLGLFLLSTGVLLYELLLMRIFSVLMWYHFASLAIGLALLGLGAGGVFVGLFGGVARRAAWAGAALGFGLWVLGLLAFLASVRSLPELARFTLAPFHQPFYEPFGRPSGGGIGWELVWRLAVLGMLAGAPFLLAGFTTAGVLAARAPRVQGAYAATLLGSAAGCLLAPLLLLVLSAPAGLAAAALLGFLSAWPLGKTRSAQLAAVLLSTLSAAALWWTHYTGAAEIPFARGHYEPELLAVRWNAMSRVAAFPVPAQELSKAFGVSRSYQGPAPPQIGLVVDDSGYTNLFEGESSRKLPEYFRSNLVALAYHLRPRARALILGPGGGKDVWIARSFPETSITAVEINPQVIEMAQEIFADFTKRPYSDPRIHLVVADARHFAATDRGEYDVIEASALFGRMPPAAGAFTLSEDLLHTTEAFRDYWNRLSPRGVLSLSRFSYEQRALRLASLARALLDGQEIRRPQDHVRVLSDRGLANVLLCKAPFTAEDDAVLEEQARQMGYRFLFPAPEMDTALARIVAGPSLAQALAALPFDVSPPTDDRPFFYYTLRPRDFLRGHGPEKTGFDDRGAQILLAALVALSGLTLVFLLLPTAALRGLPDAGRRAALSLGYAAAVGMGYIALEIGSMKRLSLFLGHPVYAAAAALFAFLIGSGAGSLLSARLVTGRRGLCAALTSAALLGLIQAYAVPGLLTAAMPLTAPLRWALAAGVLVPMAFALGIPFPALIAALGDHAPRILPWVWAVNGAASVLGSLGSVLAAMNFGYSATLAGGALLYLVALVFAQGLREPAR